MLKFREQETIQRQENHPQETIQLVSPVSHGTSVTKRKRIRYPLLRLLIPPLALVGTLYFVLKTWREPTLTMALVSVAMLLLLLHGILILKDIRRLEKEGSDDLPGSHPVHYFIEAAAYGIYSLTLFGSGEIMGFPFSFMALNSLFWGCFHLQERRRKADKKAER